MQWLGNVDEMLDYRTSNVTVFWTALSAEVIRQPFVPGDHLPFWGQWVGPVTLAFDRVRLGGGQEVNYVRGTFDVGRTAIRMDSGMFKLAHEELTKAEGLLSFDPAAASPYHLKATTTLGDIDAAPLLTPPPPTKRDPLVEGKFAVAGMLTGDGLNLDDLIGSLRQELRLTSKGGYIRILKTSVAESLPQPETPVSDALGSVGSAFGYILGLKKGTTVQLAFAINLGVVTKIHRRAAIAGFRKAADAQRGRHDEHARRAVRCWRPGRAGLGAGRAADVRAPAPHRASSSALVNAGNWLGSSSSRFRMASGRACCTGSPWL